MTIATFKRGQFTIEGHANHAPHGQDVVCAGISTLVYAFLESAETKTVEIRDGYVQVTFPTNYSNGLYYNMMINGIELIAYSYPDNVEVIKYD